MNGWTKSVERYSTLLVIKGNAVKVTVRHHFTSTSIARTKKTSVGKDVGK
jgi:hypothetical protein